VGVVVDADDEPPDAAHVVNVYPVFATDAKVSVCPLVR
jgi:hypothetical protein